MKDETGEIIDLINKNEDFDKKDTDDTNVFTQNFTNNKKVTVINNSIINSFNRTTIIDKTRKPSHRNMHIIFIENELKKRDKTIEKLTLWVLDLELSSLDGLNNEELQKLYDFLENEK